MIRAGLERRLESSQLVPGDIILLEAGDYVPADGRGAVGGRPPGG